MNREIKALQFNLNDDVKDYLKRKIDRIRNAENMIVDFIVTLKKEKGYSSEATINFRWGVSIHVKESDFELTAAIDKMMDKLEGKITKEKGKVKEKRPRGEDLRKTGDLDEDEEEEEEGS